MSSLSARAGAPEALVSGWVEAFNARDLPRMLCCLGHDVDFHPFRLVGPCGGYRGHDGVRRWFARLQQLGHEHVIDLSDVNRLDDGRVFATGTVRLGDADVAPFSGVHQLEDGLIVTARHYLSDAALVERLGLLT